ncbi:hypothetical protein GCM10023094_21140 [Rhodococcus olei]|uniref:Excreted virulence factor EspC (Type VII ESX diderm) n=1 Tax=Rhodococcus olei TaxID=2161675 RepID=A0ABP8P1P8_9NOCA
MATQNTTQNSAQNSAQNAAKNIVTDGVESITKTFDENLERVQGLNESVLGAAKLSGTVAVDAYEKAVTSVLDFQKSIAAASRIDLVTSVVDAQASLVKGITSAATTAVREALK